MPFEAIAELMDYALQIMILSFVIVNAIRNLLAIILISYRMIQSSHGNV